MFHVLELGIKLINLSIVIKVIFYICFSYVFTTFEEGIKIFLFHLTRCPSIAQVCAMSNFKSKKKVLITNTPDVYTVIVDVENHWHVLRTVSCLQPSWPEAGELAAGREEQHPCGRLWHGLPAGGGLHAGNQLRVSPDRPFYPYPGTPREGPSIPTQGPHSQIHALLSIPRVPTGRSRPFYPDPGTPREGPSIPTQGPHGQIQALLSIPRVPTGRSRPFYPDPGTPPGPSIPT